MPVSHKKVVCVGSNIESEIVLKALIEKNADVAGVVVAGENIRNSISDYADLKDLLKKNKIKRIQSDDINSEETSKAIKELTPDYIFVLGWSQILSAKTIRLAKNFVVGSHPTPLPARRGRAPIPWTVLEAYDTSAVSLFVMDEGVDSGRIISQRWFDIEALSSAFDVYMSASNALAEAFCALYEKLPLFDDHLVSSSIDVSYRGKRVPEDGILDFFSAASDIITLVKAVSFPYPGAYFYQEDKKIIVWDAEKYIGVERIGVPGQVVARTKDGIVVVAREGCIILKKMTHNGSLCQTSDFRIGSVLNYRVQDEINLLRSRISLLENKLGENG